MLILRSAVIPAFVSVLLASIGGCGSDSDSGGGGGPIINSSFFVDMGPYFAISTAVTVDSSGTTGLLVGDTTDWDFGDGNVVTGVTGTTATNTYTTSGSFDVTMTVRNSAGAVLDTLTLTSAVIIYDSALAPTGSVIGLPTGAVGPAPQSLTLDSSGLTPPAALTITGIIYEWGDGSSDIVATPSTPTGHTYSATGSYPIVVLVQYDDGTIGAVMGSTLVVTNSVWGTMIWGTDNWTAK